MPTPPTTADFLDLFRKSGILPPEELERRLAEVPDLPDDPSRCASVLVRHGLLTTFQARLLLAGRHRGFRLGPHVIREQIGQGGMGAVYLAEHATLRRRVAVKVLAPKEGVNPVAVERFLREARSAAALDHPNIVRLFDVGQHGSVHYLVLEYVDGQTLDRVLAGGGPIACGRAVEYISQAAAGLQHAYEKGFVHRDIKPGNLILAKDGTVKILDMGLARSFEPADNLTAVLDKGAVVGTADYISPEQAMNSPELDIRADIYSLGATFFTLVTGRPPFEGTTTQKLLQHQMKAAPSALTVDKTFPPGLAAVIETMLAKRPEERYQTPADVIAALAPWLPQNSKVVAGLSQTNLARSPAMQETLDQVISGGTKRLSRAEVEPEPRAKWPLIAGGVGGFAVVALVAAALGGAFSSRPAEQQQQPPAPVAAVTTTTPVPPAQADPPVPKVEPTTPKVEPNTPSAAAPKLEGVVYALDLTGRRKYSEHGKVLGDPARPTGTKWMVTSHQGDGPFPPGWQPTATTPNAEYEAVIDDALGVRTVGGSSPAALLTPDLAFPSGHAKVTIEYRTDADAGTVPVRFRPLHPRPAKGWDAGQLPATAGQWQTRELDVDLKSAAGGRFEFLAGAEPQAGLWVRGFTARDPNPATGKVLYHLDLSKQKPFVQRTVRFQEPGSKVPLKPVLETGPGKMPAGWYRWIEYPEGVAEFFADGPPGAVAFGLRMVGGTGGAQVNSPEFQAKSGHCRVRLLYQTGPTSPGFVLRFRPMKPRGGAIWDAATLPPTGGSWRLAVIDLDLKGATGGLFEVFNHGSGADAALRIRELLITDK